MILLSFIFVAIFSLLFPICSYALENDLSSIELSEQYKVQQELGSFSNIPIANEIAFRTVNAPREKSIDLLVYAGLGTIISGSSYYDFGPLGLVGVEIPFTQSHIFGFKIYANRWIGIGKCQVEEPQYNNNCDDYLGDDFSGYGISGILKCYFVGKDKKFEFL